MTSGIRHWERTRHWVHASALQHVLAAIMVATVLASSETQQHQPRHAAQDPRLEPWFHQIRPRLGLRKGGTVIIVDGQGFEEEDLIQCDFAPWEEDDEEVDNNNGNDGVIDTIARLAVQVLARYLGPERVECIAPSQEQVLKVDAATEALEISSTVLFTLSVNGKVIPSKDASSGTMTEQDPILPSYYLKFTYHDAPVVQIIRPAFGVSSGGTAIEVSGRHFINDTDLACAFDATMVVPATFVSTNKVICLTPSKSSIVSSSERSDTNEVLIQVTNNGVLEDTEWNADDSWNAVYFEYITPITVASVTPRLVSSSGGTNLLVRGHHFLSKDTVSGADLVCSFKTVDSNRRTLVQATFVSTTELRCIAPSLATVLGEAANSEASAVIHHQSLRSVTLEVTLNGVDFVPCCHDADAEIDDDLDKHSLAENISNGIQYHSPLELHGIQPSIGSVQGGADILVTGLNFVYSPRMQFASSMKDLLCCKFDFGPLLSLQTSAVQQHAHDSVVIVTPAQFMSKSQMVCKSPPVPTIALVAADEDTTMLFSNISVSVNGVDFYSGSSPLPQVTQLQYQYVLDPVVDTLEPDLGPDIGGTPIVVQGRNFYNSSDLTCHFGPSNKSKSSSAATGARAVFLNSTAVICRSPRYWLGQADRSSIDSHVDPPEANAVQNSVAQMRVVTVTNFAHDPIPQGSYYQRFVGFQYYVSPIVERMSPTHGVLSEYNDDGNEHEHENGDLVEIGIFGSDFQDTKQLCCSFTYHRSCDANATFSSAHQVSCHIPRVNRPELLPVSVSLNGVDFSSSGGNNHLQFEYLSRPNVISIHPTTVPLHHEHVFVLRGEGFVPALATDTVCQFGNSSAAAVMASSVSRNEVRCLLPADAIGQVTESPVSLNLRFGTVQAHVPVDLAVQFVAPVQVTSVSPLTVVLPSSSSSWNGKLQILGTGFYASAERRHGEEHEQHGDGWKCWFTTVSSIANAGHDDDNDVDDIATFTSHAQVNNEGSLSCPLPQDITRIAQSSQTLLLPKSSSSSTPVVTRTLLSLALSFPAQSMPTISTGDNYHLTILPPIVITKLTPKSSPNSGGSQIVVQVDQELPSDEPLICSWYNGSAEESSNVYYNVTMMSTDGYYLNATHIECDAPTMQEEALVTVNVRYFNVNTDIYAGSFPFHAYYLYYPPLVTTVDPSAIHVSPSSFNQPLTLSVYGSGFRSSSDLSCMMIVDDDVQLVAKSVRWISSERIECRFATFTNVPVGMSSYYAVKVSNNGVDYYYYHHDKGNGNNMDEEVYFQVLPPFAVNTYSPTYSFAGVSTDIELTGRNFHLDVSMFCLFVDNSNITSGAQRRSPATVLNEKNVQCASPTSMTSHNSMENMTLLLQLCDTRGMCVTAEDFEVISPLRRDRMQSSSRSTTQSAGVDVINRQLLEQAVLDNVEPRYVGDSGSYAMEIDGKALPFMEGLVCEFMSPSFVEEGTESITPASSKSTTRITTTTEATWFSDAKVVCRTPTTLPPGRYLLQLSAKIGGAITATSQNAQQITVVPSPTITQVSPSFGLVFGGTIVTIKGTHLSSPPSSSASASDLLRIYCVFGDYRSVPSHKVLDSNTIQCRTPPSDRVGSVSLSVEINDALKSSSSSLLDFHYMPPPVIQSLSPSTIPLHNNKSPWTTVIITIQLEGSLPHFVDVENNLQCRLNGERNSESSVKATTRIGNDENNHNHSILFCEFGSAATSVVRVSDLTICDTEGNVLASKSNAVRVIAPPIIFGVSPAWLLSISPTTATTATLDDSIRSMLILHGEGFPLVITANDDGDVSCLFDVDSNLTLTTPARVLSSTRVQCAPPEQGLPVGNHTVSVLIGNNNASSSWTENDERDDNVHMVEFSVWHPMSVHSIDPSCGPPGSTVTLKGTNFVHDNNLECDFSGMLSSAATVVDQNTAQCVVPKGIGSGSGGGGVQISLRKDGMALSRAGDTHTFRATQLIVSMAYPLMGRMGGGTPIRISLAGEDGLDEHHCRIFCRFGSETVQGIKEVPVGRYDENDEDATATTFTCTSPPLLSNNETKMMNTAGNDDSNNNNVVSVSVSTNGVDFVESNYSFRYLRDMIIHEISPGKGSADRNEIITIRGDHFDPRADLACRFGTSTSSSSIISQLDLGTWLSPQLFVCETGPLSLPPGRQTLYVSLNAGVEFVDSGHVFSVSSRPGPLKLQPASAFVGGSVNITIIGKGFEKGGDLACRVDYVPHVVIPALFITQNEISCRLPIARRPGDVMVQVSNNGVDFVDVPSSQPSIFRFVDHIDILAVSPSLSSCDGGTRVTVRLDKPLGRGSNDDVDVDIVTCFFGSVSVGATLLADRYTLECIAPASRIAGPVEFSMVTMGLKVPFLLTDFRYYHEPELHRIVPSLASVVYGTGQPPQAVAVAVYGSRFSPETVLCCSLNDKFDNDKAAFVVPLTYLSSDHIKCHIPADVLLAVGVYHLSVSIDCRTPGISTIPYYVVMAERRGRDLSESEGQGQGISSVASEGYTGTTGSSLLLLSQQIVVDAVVLQENSNAKDDEPTTVSVFGSDFSDELIYECHLGTGTGNLHETIFAGQWISTQHVNCVIESSSRALLPPGHYPFALSVADADQIIIVVEQEIIFGTKQRASSAALNAIVPSFGSSGEVTVEGKGFVYSTALVCRFGNAMGMATFLSTEQIRCKAPGDQSQTCVVRDAEACSAPMKVKVSVSFDEGRHFIENNIEEMVYTYFPSPRVHGISPARGSVGGGTKVEIKINEDDDETAASLLLSSNAIQYDIKCKFGTTEMIVNGAITSNSTISCLSPPLRKPSGHSHSNPNHVTLQVSVNGGYDWSMEGGAYFEYLPEVQVTSVHPPSGLFTGGYLVELEGGNFVNGLELACYFGTTKSSRVFWMSPHQMYCKVPPSNQKGKVWVTVTNNGVDVDVDMSPASANMNHRVSFEYRGMPIVEYVSPTAFYYFTATNITLTGRNFVDTAKYHCQFDQHDHDDDRASVVVHAVYRSETEIVCLTPLIVSSNTEGEQGDGLAVAVNVNFTLHEEESSIVAMFSTTLKIVHAPVVTGVTESIAARAEDISIATAATTKITTMQVQGSHMNATGAAWCKFIHIHQDQNDPLVEPSSESIISKAMLLHSDATGNTVVQCHPPPFLWTDRDSDSSSTTGRRMHVGVSTNGVNWSKHSVSYEMVRRVRLSSLIPACGSIAGGTTVTMRGLYFAQYETYHCWFGTSTSSVLAQWKSPTAILCTTPDIVVATADGSTSPSLTVDVSVSADRSPHKRSNSLTFTFVRPYSSPSSRALLEKSANREMNDMLACQMMAELLSGGNYDGKGLLDTNLVHQPEESFIKNTEVEDIGIVTAPSYLIPSVQFAKVTHHEQGGWNNGPAVMMVHVYGSSFQDGLEWQCIFDVERSPLRHRSQAVFLSEFRVSCLMPSFLANWNTGTNDAAVGKHHNAHDVLVSVVRRGSDDGDDLLRVDNGNYDVTANDHRSWTRVALPRSMGPITCASSPVGVAEGSDKDFEAGNDVAHEEETTFRPTAVIRSVAPNTGPAGREVRIVLHGHHFTQQLGCMFIGASSSNNERTHHWRRYTYLSPSEVACVTPWTLQPGAWNIIVAAEEEHATSFDNTQAIANADVEYRAYAPPQLFDVQPSFGSIHGGTAVHVRLSNAASASSLTGCYFGHTFVRATMTHDDEYDGSTLSCISPPATHAGSVPVTITINGSDRYGLSETDSTQELSFWYRDNPTMLQVVPSSGNPGGGDVITLITGGYDDVRTKVDMEEEFVKAVELEEAIYSCRFGDEQLVQATMVNATAYTCRSPPMTSLGQHKIPVSLAHTGSVQSQLQIYVSTSTNNGPMFTYDVEPSFVDSVIPSMGSVNGATLVELNGEGILNIADLACQFGGMGTTPARFESSSRVICVSPPAVVKDGEGFPLQVSVEIVSATTGFRSLASPTSVFEYYLVPTVSSVTSVSSLVSGGTHVVVEGTGFLTKNVPSSFFCRFGDGPKAVVPAEWIDQYHIVCTSPPLANVPSAAMSNDGIVHRKVAVSVNGGHDFVDSDDVEFVYLPVPRLASITPSFGALAGSTDLTVEIEWPEDVMHENSGRLECVFYDSDNWDDVGATVDVAPSSALFQYGSGLRCVTPPAQRSDEHAVNVVVSFDGQVIMSSRQLFRYIHEAVITSFWPTTGPYAGGTEVVIKGDGFTSTHNLGCFFGELRATSAYVVTTEEIRCVAPEVDPSDIMSDSGGVGVAIGVTLNGVDYFYAPSMFEYIPVPVASHMWPESASCRDEYDEAHPVSSSSVTVYGKDLGRATACRFGETGVTSAALSAEDSRVVCANPVIQPCHAVYGTNVDVFLSYDDGPRDGGVVFVNMGVSIKIINDTDVGYPLPRPSALRPVLDSLEPSVASSLGGEPIRVLGSNFEWSNQTGCYFGGGDLDRVFVPARVLSSTELICSSPALYPGFLEVQVVNGLSTLTSNESMIFEIRHAMHIHEISPTFGDVKGGTLVTLAGVFGSSESLNVGNGRELSTLSRSSLLFMCKFGAFPVVAEKVGVNEIQCRTPSFLSHAGGTIQLRISNTGGATYASNIKTFAYEGSPTVLEVYPRAAPTSGDVTVLVRGLNFKESTLLTCKFGKNATASTTSVTEYVSETEIRCHAPPADRPQNAEVFVSNNGQDFGLSGQHLEYYEMIDLNNRMHRPTFGSIEGGSRIKVEGVTSKLLSLVQCYFEGVPVSTSIVGNLTECISPMVTEADSGPNRLLSLVVEKDTPLQQVLYTGDFLSVPEPSIVAMKPLRATIEGKVRIYIQGANFVWTKHVSCRFGIHDAVVVPATLVHASVISCAVPPVTTPRQVPVSISLNGVDYSRPAPELFEYTAASLLFGSAGEDLARLTPNGTYYSTSFAVNNVTLCEPGTFQPKTGQRHCLKCPIGYACPDFGLSKPVVCQEGWVCQEMGLVWPHTKCPKGHYCLKGTVSTDTVYSLAAAAAANSSSSTSEDSTNSNNMTVPLAHPIPCPVGFFCREGVATGSADMSIKGNFSTPQPCFDGFFCPFGSFTPEGAGPCATGYYCPSPTEAVSCPIGHNCPGVGNTKPLPCIPGTHQNIEQQSSCELCSLGFVCPTAGMIVPDLCPAGYVCDSNALSSPSKLCPNGWYCHEGTSTTDPHDDTIGAVVPVSCPEGLFCLEGTALEEPPPLTQFELQIISARQCMEGYYCEDGSGEPSGSGQCWKGHYCPPGTALPLQVPVGSFASVTGAIVPSLCLPGHYAPTEGSIECRICPIGFACETYGTSVPRKCGVGSYRSESTDTACVSCPSGTFASQTASSDVTLCLPCPPGTVCGLSRTSNLTVASEPCSSGHVCGSSTNYGVQYEHESVAGYFTGMGTSPENVFHDMCVPGFSCERGTSVERQTEKRCPVNHACPGGVSFALEPSNRCPRMTVAGSGSTSLQQHCKIELVDVCDKMSTNTRNPLQTAAYYNYASDDTSSANYERFWDDANLVQQQATSTTNGGEQQTTKTIPIRAELSVAAIIDPYTFNGDGGTSTSTSSIAPWVNETIEVFRTCPSYGTSTGISEIVVIGRNFRNVTSLTCRFASVGDDRQSVTLFEQGVFLSETRVLCPLPVFESAILTKLTAAHNEAVELQCDTHKDGTRKFLMPCPSQMTPVPDGCERVFGEDPQLYRRTNAMFVPCRRPTTAYSYSYCPNIPREGMQVNPCNGGSIRMLVDVSNNGGKHFSGGSVRVPASVGEDEAGPQDSTVSSAEDYFVPGTYASFSILLPNNNESETSSMIVDDDVAVAAMDRATCLQETWEEEGTRDRESTWFGLSFMEQAHVTLDWRHLPDDPYLEYNRHYKLAIYVQPSRCSDVATCDEKGSVVITGTSTTGYTGIGNHPCAKPMDLPLWLEDPTVSKQNVLNITLNALDDVIFKVQVHILHGIAIASSEHFRHTMTVAKSSPQRAREKSDEELLRLKYDGEDDDNDSTGEKRRLSPYLSLEERWRDKEYIFVTRYTALDYKTVSQPLNLPPRWKDFEKGRVLLGMNASIESDIPAVLDPHDKRSTTTGSVNTFWNNPYLTPLDAKIQSDLYFETFHGIQYHNSSQGQEGDSDGDSGAESSSSSYSYAMDEVMLPYLPYFSNCREFDSYIPFWALVESPSRCQLPPVTYGGGGDDESTSNSYDETWWRRQYPPLPDRNDVRVVGPFNIRTFYPIADWCQRELHCHYEESLDKLESTPRWFEASTGTSLFSFIRDPVDYEQYTGRSNTRIGKDDGGGIRWLSTVVSPDVFIPVEVDREAGLNIEGGCGQRCFPRRVSLEIGYYQVSSHEKRLIEASVTFDDFDKNVNRTDYKLDVVYRPLDYQELIVKFAYPQEIFVVMFLLLGIFTVVLVALYWLVVRLTTQVENPPDVKFFSMARLIVPDAVGGFLLGGFPVLLTSLVVGLVLKGDRLLDFSSLFQGDQSATTAVSENAEFLQQAYSGLSALNMFDEEKQKGRVGLAFIIMALVAIHEGAKIFVPDKLSRLEEQVQKQQQQQEEDDNIKDNVTWTPIQWKRANFILSCCVTSLLLVVIIEWSFWEQFGRYIWEAIILLKLLGVVLGMFLDHQIHELVLMAPINTALSVVEIIVTLSADDFADFLLSYLVSLGFLIFDRMYLSPYQPAIVEWIRAQVHTTTDFVRNILAVSSPKLFRHLAPKKRTKGGSPAEEGTGSSVTVEPIIDSFSSYCCDTVSLFSAPCVICLIVLFRDETEMPALYQIKEHDMDQYLIFSFIIVPFQIVADILIHSALELFHGWKVHDYVRFAKWKFARRTQRWRGFEVESLDENIDESMRSMERMCFSSQYYMILTIQVCGIVYLVLGIEIMVRAKYNAFQDPATILVVVGVSFFCWLVKQLYVRIGLLSPLWRPTAAFKVWNIEARENDLMPDYSADNQTGAIDYDQHYLNERMMQESFRHKFVHHNRAWLIDRLPEMLTPRTVRQNRPLLANQLSRVLQSVDHPDISSDDESGDGNGGGRGEGVQSGLQLSQPLQKSHGHLLTEWRRHAQRRLQMKNTTRMLTLRARKEYCQQCLSRVQLNVEPVIDIGEL
jgi:hypothetical protein